MTRGQSEKKNRRSHEQIMDCETQPGGGPAQRPARIVKAAPGSGFDARAVTLTGFPCAGLEQCLDVGHGCSVREAGLAQVKLIAIFQRSEQFDALKRT